MNKKRLLKLADFLETVPTKSFYMGTWGLRDADRAEGKVPGECGFAGCAMGWAAHAELFRGLTPGLDNGGGAPSYEGRFGYGAAEKLFTLDADAAEHLFSPYEYRRCGNRPTPKQVAKRIRKFVETGTV